MERVILFGWNSGTWKRAFAWATAQGIVLPERSYAHPHAPEMALRKYWLERGGPMSGPTGQVLLDA